MPRYDKQTWDTTSYVNPTRMNHIEQGIYDADLRNGGNITGDLYINDESGTTSTEGTTYLSVGNDIAVGTNKNSTGILRLYGDTGKCAFLYPETQLSANRWIALPDKAGTLALTSELVKEDTYTITSAITINANSTTALCEVPNRTIGVMILNYNDSNLNKINTQITQWYSSYYCTAFNNTSSAITIPANTTIRYYYI